MKRLFLFLLSATCFISLRLSAQAPPLGQVVVTHVFNEAEDSPDPQYGLIELPNGNFAGVTQGNHANNLASRMVYEMTPAGVVTPLVRFGPRVTQLRINADLGGSYQLLQASDGNFYGVASSAGLSREGNLYRLTPAGVYSVEYLFGAPARGGLAESLDGGLYGFGMDPATLENGIYRFDPTSGQLKFVYESSPFGSSGTPVFGDDGNVYGLNETVVGFGTSVFSFNPVTSALQDLADFSYQQAFGNNSDPIIIAPDGSFWFAQPANQYPLFGCPSDCGSILEASGGQALVPYMFNGQNNNGTPVSLIQASDGNFYGVTSPVEEQEQVFQFNPSTNSLASYPIPSGAGAGASGPLLQDSNGYLRGTNSEGAAANGSPGAVFILNLGLPSPIPSVRGFAPSSGLDGTTVKVLGSYFVNVSAVTLNGQTASFSNPASGAVLLTVPAGASSGPIVITTPAGTAISAGVFQVE